MKIRSVRIIDSSKSVLYEGPIFKLPLNEQAVRKKFDEIYGECVRCKNRMAAVRGMLYWTLDEYFDGFEDGKAIPLADISPEILDYLVI